MARGAGGGDNRGQQCTVPLRTGRVLAARDGHEIDEKLDDDLDLRADAEQLVDHANERYVGRHEHRAFREGAHVCHTVVHRARNVDVVERAVVLPPPRAGSEVWLGGGGGKGVDCQVGR